MKHDRRSKLARASRRIAGAQAKRAARRRTKTPAQQRRSREYLDDQPVRRRDGKGMARRFRKGNPGRPRGAKNIIPPNVRASVKDAIERIVSDNIETIEKALLKGLRAKADTAVKYLRLSAEYTDGKPAIEVSFPKWNQDEVSAAAERVERRLRDLFGALERETDAPKPKGKGRAAR